MYFCDIVDRLTPEQRKRTMQAVKSKNSQLEISLGKALWAKGYRYRKNDKRIFGKLDFTFTKYRAAVFCDSEFWHGKDWGVRKFDHKTNQDFWLPKIERNIERDREVNAELARMGWVVLRFWGKDIIKNIDNCVKEIDDAISKRK